MILFLLTFNSVLYKRATCKSSVEEFGKSKKNAIYCLQSEGKDKIVTLNKDIKEIATTVVDKIEE